MDNDKDINEKNDNNDNDRLEVECPWCQKKLYVEQMPDNMIMAFNCTHCEEPIVVIHGKPIKIDKEILESGEILRLQEYLLDILEKEFNIIAEITEFEQLGPDGKGNKEEDSKDSKKSGEKKPKKTRFTDQRKLSPRSHIVPNNQNS